MNSQTKNYRKLVVLSKLLNVKYRRVSEIFIKPKGGTNARNNQKDNNEDQK